MLYVIEGATPSQKNRKRITCRGGRPRMYTDPKVKAWQDSAHIQLLEQRLKVPPGLDYPVALMVTVFYGDNRRHDLDNALSSVLDALVKAGVIEDDNSKFVNYISIQGGFDKSNPRAEIEIDNN